MALGPRDPDTLPAGVEHMRRQAFDLSTLDGRVTSVERALTAKLGAPPSGTVDGSLVVADVSQPGGVKWQANRTRVTSLPASPFDGQEVYWEVATGFFWHLRYNAGSASVYKWECVGGDPFLQRAYNNDAGMASAVYVNCTTDDAFVVPRAGEYVVTFGATFGNAGAGVSLVGINGCGYSPSDNESCTGSGGEQSVMTSVGCTFTTSGTIRMAYRVTASTVNVNRRHVALFPRRIA